MAKLKNFIVKVCLKFNFVMNYFSSFAIGGFVPSAAIAGVLLLVGLGAFFYLGIKGPSEY